MSDIRMTGADHSHTNAITIDARCRDDFCVRNKPDIYRMVGDCENCGTKGILFLLTAEHERGYDHKCPVCGNRRARPRRLATEDEIPAGLPEDGEPEGSP